MINELSTITTIPVLALKKLFRNLMFCICHQVLQSFHTKKTETCVDLEFGKLGIIIQNDCIQYKFIPSQYFEQILINTINSKKSPLISEVENTITSRIGQAYKELL